MDKTFDDNISTCTTAKKLKEQQIYKDGMKS